MGAISQLVHLLAKAESGGGFDLIAGTLKRVGRYPREHDVRDSRRSVGTLPLPNHDFDIDVVKWADGTYILLIAGRPRYAGFTFSCGLPPRTFTTELVRDPINGISWRAEKLFRAMQEDQAGAGS